MPVLLQKKTIVITAAALLSLAVWQLILDEHPPKTGDRTPAPRHRKTPTAAAEPVASSPSRFRPAQRMNREKQTHQTAPPVVRRRTPGHDRAIIEHPSNKHSRNSAGRNKASVSNTSTRLDPVLGDSGLSVRQRVAALDALDSPLSRGESEAIFRGIENPIHLGDIGESSWHWLVDELITTLRKRGAAPGEIRERLEAIHRDTSRSIVVRDYALQHLGHLRSESVDTEPITRTLTSAVAEKRGPLAGTALLALNQTRVNRRAGEAALAVAADPTTDIRSRITAIQVAGRQGNPDALPLAVEIATATDQPIPFRMAAIATLGDLRAVGQWLLLSNLSTAADPRLRTAARAALKKLTPENQ